MWAAVFPGQGSQHVGMGQFLYDNFSEARDLFTQASDLLSVDFKKLCFSGPESELALTENTQPALLLVSVAAHQVLQSLRPLSFKAAAGHSVGEYAACVVAGAISFADALRAVRLRGRAMQSAVPVGEGGMVAILGLSDEQVESLCQWVESASGFSPLNPANFNSPGQVVVSGRQQAIDWLLKQDLQPYFPGVKRAKLIPLKVSAPFHCAMMMPAEEKMAGILEKIEFSDGRFPVVQNVHAQPTIRAVELRANLVQQISRPVRWVECVSALPALGVSQCIELGPGRVLSGLIKKIDRVELNTFNMTSLAELTSLTESLAKEGL